VPLKKQAIQLSVFGEASQQADLIAIRDDLLASLDGPTNWLTASEQGEQLGKAVGFAVVLIGAAIAFFVVNRRKNRRAADAAPET
jgi:hypothetical protein